MTPKKKALLAAAISLAAFFLFRFVRPADDIANFPPRSGPIIALGDSLTAGFGAQPGEAYPDRLAKLIGRDVVNRGVGGETAADALRRLDRDVLAEKPGVVIVCLGGNDLLQRRDPEATFRALDEITERCVRDGALVVLVGIQGIPLVSPDFKPRFKDVARRHACLYVPDILGGIFSKPELMADGIHPNAKGYEIVAQRIADALKPVLN